MIYILNFLLLSSLSLFVVFFSPDQIVNQIIFFILISLTFFVFSRFFINKLKINLILSVYFTLLLVLQMFGLLNIINISLAGGLGLLIYITT